MRAPSTIFHPSWPAILFVRVLAYFLFLFHETPVRYIPLMLVIRSRGLNGTLWLVFRESSAGVRRDARSGDTTGQSLPSRTGQALQSERHARDRRSHHARAQQRHGLKRKDKDSQDTAARIEKRTRARCILLSASRARSWLDCDIPTLANCVIHSTK